MHQIGGAEADFSGGFDDPDKALRLMRTKEL